MNNHEAKFLLEAYRANGGDAGCPVFGEALKQARRDPALGAWFERAQACDAALAGKLRAVAPPDGLREAILAGARAGGRPQRRWSRPAPWLALAASIALLVTVSVTVWPKRGAGEEARLTAFAFDDTAHGQHGGHGAATGAFQTLLSQPTTRMSAGLPVDFPALRSTGCRTLSFAGHDVLEICFNRDGAWFHCYIAKRSDFPSRSTAPAAVFARQASLASASWSDATHHFVVVSEAGLEAVKRLW